MSRGLLLVAGAGLVTMLLRLGEGDLIRDEVLYAAIAKTTLVHDTWLDLHLGDDPYWKKPPLMFWLAAVAYRTLGFSAFSARLFPGLLGVLSCVLLYLIARRLFDERIGVLAGLALATTPRFLNSSASFNLDTPVVCFTLAGLLVWVQAIDRPRWWHPLVAGAMWGLALMAKGAFGLLGPGVVLVYLAVQRRLRLVLSRPFILSLVAAAAVGLPWHVYAATHWGADFVRTYLGQEIVDRMAGRLWPDQRIDSYAVELVRDDWPWIAFTVIGTVDTVSRWRSDRNLRFVGVWALGYLLALHASVFHRGQYLMHFYPPSAILAAFGVRRLLPSRWLEYVPRVAAIGLAIAGLALVLLPVRLRNRTAAGAKALRPVVDRLLADRTAPLVGFHTNVHFRAESLFYLDRDVHNRTLAELSRSHATVVVAERQFREALAKADFDEVYADKRYVVFRTAPARTRDDEP